MTLTIKSTYKSEACTIAAHLSEAACLLRLEGYVASALQLEDILEKLIKDNPRWTEDIDDAKSDALTDAAILYNKKNKGCE